MFLIHSSHTHPFNGPLSGTTQVSQYQKGKTNMDFTEARDSGISWAICKSRHNHASVGVTFYIIE